MGTGSGSGFSKYRHALRPRLEKRAERRRRMAAVVIWESFREPIRFLPESGNPRPMGIAGSRLEPGGKANFYRGAGPEKGPEYSWAWGVEGEGKHPRRNTPSRAGPVPASGKSGSH